MQIVDAHHHLWDLRANYYPWLTDQIVPKPYGDYAAIRRDYLVSDLFGDIGALPVVKSVHIQAGHDPRDPVRETAWLQSVADAPASRGFPQGIVADADFRSPDLARTLEAHCRHRNMRGVRQILNYQVTDPAHHPDLLRDSTWRENVKLLRRFNLSFDLQIHPKQAMATVALARANPEIQIILCHAGFPIDQSHEGRAFWLQGIRALAELPNVAVKISGFSMFDPAWTVESIRPFVFETIELFGAARCMLGSNFPVDKLHASYRRIWESFDEITSALSESERAALYGGNALRFYRL